jgi:arsenate reductase
MIDCSNIQLIDIKTQNISEIDLDFAKEKLGSYEALFSKRAMKYRSMGLNEMDLNEEDFKTYILQEYTFLKRPVAFIDGEVFAGNSKKNVEALIKKVNG